MDNKKIETGKAEATPNSGHNIVEVMKPFVKFGVKALGLLGSVLVHIVKSIPRPDDHKQAPNKNDRVIKIYSHFPNSWYFLMLMPTLSPGSYLPLA